MKKVNKKGLIVASGAAIAAFLVIKRLSAKENGDIVDPKEALRDILGTTPAVGEGTTVYNIPGQPDVTFPEMERYADVFAPSPAPPPSPTTAPERAAAARRPASEAILTPKKAGVGFGVMPSGEVGFAPAPGYVEGVGYGVGVYPIAGAQKETAYERGAREESESAAYLAGHPTLEMRDGAIVKKQVLPSGAAPVISALQSSFVSRATGGSSSLSPKKQPTSSGGGGSSYRTGTRRTSVTGKYSGR